MVVTLRRLWLKGMRGEGGKLAAKAATAHATRLRHALQAASATIAAAAAARARLTAASASGSCVPATRRAAAAVAAPLEGSMATVPLALWRSHEAGMARAVAAAHAAAVAAATAASGECDVTAARAAAACALDRGGDGGYGTPAGSLMPWLREGISECHFA
eukprot:351729-Chlamydomonas_euryale.AAC.1